METSATASDTTAASAALPSTSPAQSTSPALLAPSPKVPLDQFGAMQIEESSDGIDEPAEAKQPTTGREAKWDDEDEVWRCWDCFWEVEHGECVRCAKLYDRSEETVAEEEMLFADSEQLEPVVPKTRPPSPWLPEAFLAAAKEPLAKEDQVKCLLARGATTDMIERYDLEYSPLHGIIATADDELEEFFFPDGFELAQYERPQEIAKLREEDENFFPREPFPMQKPNDKHPWRIHLGDLIELSPLDVDGSDFVFNAAESLLWQSDHGRAATVVEQFGPYGQDGQHFVTRKLDKEDEEIMTLSEFGAKWPSNDHLYDAHELDILCIPVKCDGNYEPLLLAEAKKSDEETEELNATTAELWAGSENEQEEDDESEAQASGGDVSMQVEEEEQGGDAEQPATERMQDEPEEPGEIFEFA